MAVLVSYLPFRPQPIKTTETKFNVPSIIEAKARVSPYNNYVIRRL